MKKYIFKIIFALGCIFLLSFVQNYAKAKVAPACKDHLENWFCYDGGCVTNTDESWCDN